MKVDMDRISPMMKYYLGLKEQYKDSILLFRLGDFYEMFFEDAETASKVLDLTLTGRDCGLEARAPMCGVPYHAVENYIAKLIDNGYRVAVCEQLTTPEESKGKMVERDVVRVITPGTLTDESMLTDNVNNYLASVISDENKTGLAWADLSTGEFYAAEFNSDSAMKTLEDTLIYIRPREILSTEQAYMLCSDLNTVRNGELPKFRSYYDWTYEYDNAVKSLLKQFKVKSLDAFEIGDRKYAVSAAGALIEYLLETQKRSLEHINGIQYVRDNTYMFLDSATRRNLEITETLRERRKKGSLLWLLDDTVTSMGGRTIRKWLEQPLIDSAAINRRLDAVEELTLRRDDLIKLREIIGNIRDLERLSGKVAYGSLNPRDCLSINESLSMLPSVKAMVKTFKSAYLKDITADINPLEETASLLESAIDPNAPALIKDGGYIKSGYNKELDELREIKSGGERWIAEIEATEKETTGIKTLKVGFNRVFGYYIEIPKSSADKAPYRYVRKQTLSNCERFITEELKKIEDKVLHSEEQAIALEAELFKQIKERLSADIRTLQCNARAVGDTDVLCAFAMVALNDKYSRPKIDKKINRIYIKDGRHPVVEAMLSANEYVINDTLLDSGDNSTMIITGPNMAGKSTYMRQVALITLMAHIGSFVPAKEAEIVLTDRIFTRVGASDDVAYGQSTFMVEMIETATILNNATDRSLLILDEIGRGTSTYDGLSIAWAVMEYITSRIRSKTMFATHYHELTELEGTIKGVKNYRILVNEHKGGIVFLHKIVRGGTNKSFGIEVAGLAGVPEEVIKRAKQIAKALEANDINKDSNSIMLNAIGIKDNSFKQMSFIGENKESEIMRTLKDMNIDNCSPMQAFMILSELIEKAKNEKN